MRPAAERTTDELLAAYVDGVGELTTDERRRVEARLADDPTWRTDAAATRDLLGTLRALPDEGTEPDWAKMERAIRDEVGDSVPRSWWRGWRWLIPVGALAISGAVLALVLRTPDVDLAPTATHATDAGVASVAPTASQTVPLWLDGSEIEVELDAAELLDLHLDLHLDLDLDEDAIETGNAGTGLLPSSDLAWLDELGDDDMAAAEAWLARKKS